ncbi:MAG: BspA family leucine-rich repeat surface protein [Flagellimonas sp.]
MNTKNLFCVIISLVLLWSCGKDDGTAPTPKKNSAPKIEAQSFTVAEDISDDVTIGTVKAADADQDELTFSIITNDSNLFEISDSGSLSLATGKSLNFSSKAQHQIVVSVTDGEDSTHGSITIKITEVTAANQAPQLEDQSFDASEDIANADVIGTVEASDAEDDELTFSIIQNDGELFEIDENTGELSLVEGQNLDFELSQEHTISISVTDGTSTSEASITIIVGNVADSLSEDSTSFVTKWKTEVADEEIIVGTNDELDLTYDYTIDWGDGIIEDLTEGNPSHIYTNPGTYTVAINGQFPSIRIDKDLFDFEPITTLISIEQWGTIQWINLESAFHNCENMEYNAIDAPDLSQITSLWNMFRSASKFSGADLNQWDVSTVTNMTGMFNGTDSNLLVVSQWNVENVVQMGIMFRKSEFNDDLSNWNVSNVEDMGSMFAYAPNFNGNLSAWDVSNVTDMSGMFSLASTFNQDLSAWNVGNVIFMEGMFHQATSFNQDISNWQVQNVTNMYLMFWGADSFNQNLGNWEISSLEPGNIDGDGLYQTFDNSGMSPENLSATLIGWANNPNTALGVVCGIEGLSMCDSNEAIDAYAKLAAELEWQFSNYPDLVNCQ